MRWDAESEREWLVGYNEYAVVVVRILDPLAFRIGGRAMCILFLCYNSPWWLRGLAARCGLMST
jgi:hypothetical protein